MSKVYIHSVGSVSAQKTFVNKEFLDEIVEHADNVIYAVDPDYKEFIPPAAARRMAKGIKMGVVASKIALDEAGQETVDAIITGTGLGCTIDSEKFVSALIDNKEEFLTPTSFIQSMHNTVGGQIALGLGCKGYNLTYVHGSISFESALLDAQLQLENDEASTILVGGVDEIGEHTTEIHKRLGHVKKEAVKSTELLDSNTPGAVFGEGANFFVLCNQLKGRSYAELLGLKTYNTLSVENSAQAIRDFLAENGIALEDIDLIVMGNNGDVTYDPYYRNLATGLFKNTSQACYKHLSGEFYTASSFGFWLACKILKHQIVPNAVKYNDVKALNLNTVLLYHQYRRENHSFILLRKC